MNRIHGINLPYFFDAYGHDLAPNAVIAMGPGEIDPMRIYAALLAARERGFARSGSGCAKAPRAS